MSKEERNNGKSLDDIVRISEGYIRGYSIGEGESEMHIYKGIPYAEPPVGEMRWREPDAKTPWEGTLDCTEFRSHTAQSMLTGYPLTGEEDSLYLSVVTPARSQKDSLPVMVWMHGGGYTIGSGNSDKGHNPRLPAHGVVLVHVNMRLGAIGLLAHPMLTRESEYGTSGNYMFHDMILALRWVQRNIENFGGNPDNVTIFGQSGGGAKIANLMSSPLGKGLFHKAICESGTSYDGFFPGASLSEMEAIGEEIFNSLGIKSLKEARAVRWQDIVGKSIDLGLYLKFDSIVDNRFLNDFPKNVFRKGNQHKIPFILCANLGEVTTGAKTYVFPTFIPGYTNMLNGAYSAGVDRYVCIFDQVPSLWKEQGVTSIHAMELTYVFGDWDNSIGEWSNTWVLAKDAFNDQISEDPGLTDSDRYVSEAVMEMWSNFAKSGCPDIENNIKWPVWTPESDGYLYIVDPLTIKQGFSEITSDVEDL